MTFSPRVTGGRKSGSRGMFVALLVGVIALHIVAQPLAACEIPVFRYALERWNPDNYQVLVLHRQSMTAEQRALVAKLQQAASDPAHPANLEVIPIDLAAKSDDPTIKLLQKQHETLAAPLLALRQPHTQPDAKPIWTAPLSAENIERLVDSPARKEIISRLTSGQSAVWVMLETGNAQQDDAAAATLEKELARLAKELKLPEKDVLEADEFFKPETKVPLQVSFSLLRLKPGQAVEEAFRAMLISSEADLTDLKEPITMPVFGRGRACFALVGKGINAKQIEDNCRFLVGRCSCQVKYDNPGVDLLLAANWDGLVGGRSDVSKPLPELSGLGVLVVDVEPADATSLPSNAPKLPTKLGQHVVTPVPAAPQDETAKGGLEKASQEKADPKIVVPATVAQDKIEDPQGAEKESNEPRELADARPLPTNVGPNTVEDQPRLFFLAPLVGVAIVAGVGLVLVVLGTLWLKNRGGAGS